MEFASLADAEHSATSQRRAANLHSKIHKVKAAELESAKRALFEKLQKQYGEKFDMLRTTNLGTLWRTFVTNRADAEAMMEIMYPQLPKQVQQAYVHMFERAVRGEIQLDERLIQKGGTMNESTVWDPLKEIEKEKMEGLLNVQQERVRQIMLDKD